MKIIIKIIKIIIFRFFALFGYSLINLVNEEKHRVKFWSGLLPGEIRSIFQYEMFLKTLSLSGNIVECGVATMIQKVVFVFHAAMIYKKST